jgi:hypothetical protein
MGPVADRAKSHTSGRIAAAVKPFAAGLKAGIRVAHPGAGVHEFATRFKRHRPGGGPDDVGVVWTDPAPPPRYGWRAVDELHEATEDAVLDAVQGVARAHGWLR